MGNISSSNKSPYAYIGDLFQSQMHKYVKDMNKKGFNFVIGRTMRRGDPKPSWYFTPVITEVQQTGIGDQKTVFKKHDMLVMYYTENLDEDLFTIEQIITQIIVSNNKVSDTKRIKNTGQEFMQLKRLEYAYVYDSEDNLEMQSIFATVTVAYQDSYYGVN